MADAADGFATRFLQRTDGSLLTLNLATLTLVAGLEKFGDGEISRFVNLQVLVGGLCVGLFFAILCAYYTAFGARAAAAPARRFRGSRPFDEELTLPGIDSAPGLGRLGAWFVVCLAPLLVLAVVMRVGDSGESHTRQEVVRLDGELEKWCSRAPGTALAQTSPETAVATEKRPAKPGMDCLGLKQDRGAAKDAFEKAGAFRTLSWNVTFIVVASLYLISPFVAWWGGARFARTRPWQSRSARRRRELHARIDCIQGLRLAVALLSLAAFVIGVGLALVNTGVAKLNAGFAESPPPLPSSEERREGADPYAPTAGGSGGAGGRGGLGGQGGSAAVNVPEAVTLKLGIDPGLQWPAQTVVLEGLERLPIQTTSSIPSITIPSSITLSGFPKPSESSVFVQPAPTPPEQPAAPKPPSAEEIAQALEARSMVKVCDKAYLFGLIKRGCSYQLQSAESVDPKAP